MYNHFLKFSNETEAKAALPDFTEEEGWNESLVIPNQKIIIARGTGQDPDTTAPGYYLTISLDDVNEDIKALANNACRLIGDAESGAVVYMAPDVNANLMATAIIEPVPMGAKYNFL